MKLENFKNGYDVTMGSSLALNEKNDCAVRAFANAFAITYQQTPSLTFGVQALWAIEFPDWHEQGDDVVSIGPSVSYQSQGWWLAVSPLFQVTNVDSEPDLQIRLLFGIDF